MDKIFMPSNFGERGGAVPAFSKLMSSYPHDEEKDFALNYMNPRYKEKMSRNKAVAASQTLENMKGQPLIDKN